MKSCTKCKEFIEHIDKLSILKYGCRYDSVIMDIDHIIPLISASTEEEMVKLNHYTNLQPLSKEDHKIKTKEDIKRPKEGQ